jgi:hypothetical protein
VQTLNAIHVSVGKELKLNLFVSLTYQYVTREGLVLYPGEVPEGEVLIKLKHIKIVSPDDVHELHTFVWIKLNLCQLLFVKENEKALTLSENSLCSVLFGEVWWKAKKQ